MRLCVCVGILTRCEYVDGVCMCVVSLLVCVIVCVGLTVYMNVYISVDTSVGGCVNGNVCVRVFMCM